MLSSSFITRTMHAAVLLLALGLSAPGLCGAAGASTLQIEPDHPILGAWKVYHSSAVAYCEGVPLPVPAEGPDRVEIIAQGDGTVLVDGMQGQLIMRRVTPQRFESEIVDGMQVIKRVDPGEWALLAEALGEDGVLYTGEKTVGGVRLAYLLGWMRSEPGVLRGHISMVEGPCDVVRSFRAEK